MTSEIETAFAKQVAWCERLGSPFTAALLRHAAAVSAHGPLAALIGDWPGDPVADALPLRVAAALHALVLSGAAPAWLRFEPAQPESGPDLMLQIWPGLPETRLATAHPHGSAVTWLTP